MKQEIGQLRGKIDRINRQIFDLIIRRIRVALEIAQYKKSHKLKIVDHEREQGIIKNMRGLAQKSKVDPGSIEHIFQDIIDATKKEMKK